MIVEDAAARSVEEELAAEFDAVVIGAGVPASTSSTSCASSV